MSIYLLVRTCSLSRFWHWAGGTGTTLTELTSLPAIISLTVVDIAPQRMIWSESDWAWASVLTFSALILADSS